jgi:hypothetical protein
MSIKLKTDDLSPGLGNNFRNDLVDNFTKTEQAINRLDSDTESPAVIQLKQNIKDIVTILADIDVPIRYDGKNVIDTREE